VGGQLTGGGTADAAGRGDVGGRDDGADPAVALLPRSFFDRPALEVAPELLGCVLEHQTPGGLVAAVLTEVEAYAGAADPASHAYRGQTPRNAVMFGPPGYSYVYFTYGMHFCVNLVCLPEGTAEAVLLRAGTIVEGVPLARLRRPAARADTDLARGPARLCQALAIDRALDGADVCSQQSELRIHGYAPGPGALAAGAGSPPPTAPDSPSRPVRTGLRVGVRKGAELPWRFWIDGDPTVSAYRPYTSQNRNRSNKERPGPVKPRPPGPAAGLPLYPTA